MNNQEFERLYVGIFKPNCDWPEVEKSKFFSGIYAHKCNVCGVEFYGYKRRVLCYVCDQRLDTKYNKNRASKD